MSYKPLSQTVTDGQNNPISSDAVYDAIDAIPDGANTALSNLAAPTAINQDLKLDSGKRVILQSPGGVATGVNAVTPSNSGTTTITTDASITDVLQIGDLVYLSGITNRIAEVLTKAGNGLSFTVSNSLGGSGGGTTREIFVLKEYNRLVKSDGNLLQSTVSVTSYNAPLLFSRASNLFIGSTTSLPGGANNIYIGSNVGVNSTATGSNNNAQIIIGHNSSTIVNSGSTIVIGSNSSCTGNQGSVIIGGSASGQGHVILGNSAQGSGVSIGRSSNSGGNGISILSDGTLGNAFSIGTATVPILYSYLTQGSTPVTTNRQFYTHNILPARASGTNISAEYGDLVLMPTLGTGNGLSGNVKFFSPLLSQASGSANPRISEHLVVDTQQKLISVFSKLQTHDSAKIYNGDLEIESAGKGLKIAEGTDATMGVATLAAGTATVSTSAVASNSRIMLSIQALGTVSDPKPMAVTGRTAGQDFTITSSDNTDTSEVAWMIINPLVGTDSDAEAFFTAASITDATQKTAVTTLVTKLKKNNLWSKCVALYPFVGGTSSSHSYNLKDTTQYQISWYGSITHDANGITGDGTTGYGDLGFSPDLLPTDITLSIYINTNSSIVATEFGSANAGSTNRTSFDLVKSNEANYSRIYIRGSQMPLIYPGPSNKFFQMSSYGPFSGEVSAWLTGPISSGGTAPAQVSNTNNFYICAENVAGVASRFSSRRIALMSVASGFSHYEMFKFKELVEEFQTTLSRAN